MFNDTALVKCILTIGFGDNGINFNIKNLLNWIIDNLFININILLNHINNAGHLCDFKTTLFFKLKEPDIDNMMLV